MGPVDVHVTTAGWHVHAVPAVDAVAVAIDGSAIVECTSLVDRV